MRQGSGAGLDKALSSPIEQSATGDLELLGSEIKQKKKKILSEMHGEEEGGEKKLKKTGSKKVLAPRLSKKLLGRVQLAFYRHLQTAMYGQGGTADALFTPNIAEGGCR